MTCRHIVAKNHGDREYLNAMLENITKSIAVFGMDINKNAISIVRSSNKNSAAMKDFVGGRGNEATVPAKYGVSLSEIIKKARRTWELTEAITAAAVEQFRIVGQIDKVTLAAF